jgi:polysaccharide export outer membrane protein
LPYFGRVKAQGMTVERVRTTLQEMVGSITYRVFEASTLASVLEVAPNDVVLEIERYRDVSVLGYVATPGMIPFSPGMTVRSAIAAAGGVFRQNAAAGGGTDLAETAMRLAEISRLTHARAGTRASVWRLESVLGENPPTPTAAELGLNQEQADELLALQAEMLATEDKNHREVLEMLDNLDVIFAKRTQYLEEQQKFQIQALEGDRNELARIRSLAERGLVLADRVHEMTRTQYLSEAALLQTQGEVERLRIQRAQSDGERRKLDADRREAGLAELAEARRVLFELDSQISGMQSALALAAPGVSPNATSFAVTTEAVIHRGTGDEAAELRPGLDALVEPGDAIEIVITDTTAPEPAVGNPVLPTPSSLLVRGDPAVETSR